MLESKNEQKCLTTRLWELDYEKSDKVGIRKLIRTKLAIPYVDEAIETGQAKMEFVLYSPPSSYYFACCVYISGILKAQHIKKYLFVINGQTNACIIARKQHERMVLLYSPHHKRQS